MGIKGVLRQYNQDFCVTEELGFEPAGQGEHVFLWIEKNGANTEWVAKQLAKYAGVPQRDVSFAGVKDRHAITQQWFSVWIKNQSEPDWLTIQNKEFTIVKATRHSRKIKRGTLKGNHFKITLRNLEYDGSEKTLQNNIQQRIDIIAQQGVPNYFGEQRFGRDENNIKKAEAWFANAYKPRKTEKTWLLSAARSKIFNQILTQRIENKTWQTVLADDIVMLNGTQSIFAVDDVEKIQARFLEQDLHITGSLYGGALIKQEVAGKSPRIALEHEVYAANKDLCEGLDKNQLQSARRALRVIPQALDFTLNTGDKSLVIKFYLYSGCYATTVLKEIVQYLE